MIAAKDIKKAITSEVGRKQASAFHFKKVKPIAPRFRVRGGAKTGAVKVVNAIRIKAYELLTEAKRLNINPYADKNGMPKDGNENEFFYWEKQKADEVFNAMPLEQQIALRQTSERFAKKMNS